MLMNADHSVKRTVTFSPTSAGYGHPLPTPGMWWGHGIAVVGFEPLPGQPDVLGVRLLVTQLTGSHLFDLLLAPDGSFARSIMHSGTDLQALTGNDLTIGGRIGISVASADVNGDGAPDAILGADSEDDLTGGVAVVFADPNDEFTFTHAVTITSPAGGLPAGTLPARNQIGYTITWLGPWGDGTNALAIGGGAHVSADVVLILGLLADGTVSWSQTIGSGQGGMPTLSLPSQGFGAAVAAIDLDGQAPMDLVITVADFTTGAEMLFLCVLDRDSRLVSSFSQVSNGVNGLPPSTYGDSDVFGSAVASVLAPSSQASGTRTLFVGARFRGASVGAIFAMSVQGSQTRPGHEQCRCRPGTYQANPD